MKIKVICIGKTQKGFINQGINEYLSRLKHYINIELVEIPTGKKSRAPSIDIIKNEAEQIRKKYSANAIKVILSERGREFTSIKLSKWLEQRMIEGREKIDFVIGGDLGLHPSLISEADLNLSLSRMTCTHQMSRVILLEQLYRAFTIIKGEPYHH